MANDRTKELQNKTNTLLKQIQAGKIATKDIEDLRDVLRFHEYRYYIQNDPLVSDFEYDIL